MGEKIQRENKWGTALILVYMVTTLCISLYSQRVTEDGRTIGINLINAMRAYWICFLPVWTVITVYMFRGEPSPEPSDSEPVVKSLLDAMVAVFAIVVFLIWFVGIGLGGFVHLLGTLATGGFY